VHIYPNLWAGGLLAVHSSGRQRYYRLAGPEVAHALEALGAISTKTSPVPNHRPRANHDLYNARSCYDHLAGRIAVELARALEQSQIIRRAGESQYELGSKGHGWFTHLGIDVDSTAAFTTFFGSPVYRLDRAAPASVWSLGSGTVFPVHCARMVRATAR